MPQAVKEVGNYKRMAASGSIVGPGGTLLEFICTTTGTLAIQEDNAGSADIVSQIAVTAGVVYPLGLNCPTGAKAVIAGGAVGTFVC